MKRRSVWLIAILAAVLVAGGAAAYLIMSITGEVTVEEAITIVGDDTFAFKLYPQETATQVFALANASSLDMEVDLDYTITPPEGSDLKVTLPKKVTVPAGGQGSFTLVVEAKKSCPPGIWSITIGVNR